MKTTTLFLILLLAGFQAAAFTPESGHYWDPDEPGTGYTIEIQDNNVFATFYVYDDDGFPVWYTAQAFLDGNSSFSGRLVYSEGGQCLGCYWSQNNSQYSGYGTIYIEFLTETTAEFTVLGVTKTIERFNYYLGDELQKMRGEWQVVSDMTEYVDYYDYPFFADVIVFEQTEIYEGLYMATGCRSGSTVDYIGCTDDANYYNNVAASIVNDELLIIVDHSDTHYLAYVVDDGTDQFDGAGFYYRKGTNFDPILTNEPGYVTRGFRSASKSFIQTGVGPSVNIPTKSKGWRSLNLPETNTNSASSENKKNKAFYDLRKKLEQYLTEKREKNTASK